MVEGSTFLLGPVRSVGASLAKIYESPGWSRQPYLRGYLVCCSAALSSSVVSNARLPCPLLLGKIQRLQALKQPQIQQRIEREVHDSIDQPTTLTHDLTRQLDETLQELLEFHAKYLMAQARLLDQQAIPRFYAPGQGPDDHRDPVRF